MELSALPRFRKGENRMERILDFRRQFHGSVSGYKGICEFPDIEKAGKAQSLAFPAFEEVIKR